MCDTISPSRRWALSALAAALPAVSGGQPVLEEVRVVGTPHDQSPTELAQSITVLRGDTLRRVQGSNLGETLAGELGVSSSYFGSGASRPVIRGLAGARVRTMEDGIDSLDVSTVSPDHAVGVDPLVAEQIEIFRGPATLLYGSGAVGGVVNTITNRIPEGAPPEGFEGAVDLRADTVADDRAGAVRIDAGRDAVAWHFDGSHRRAGDYDIPGFARLEDAQQQDGQAGPEAAEGFVPNSDFETTSAAFGLSRLGERGFFGASLSGFETDYGIPGHADEEHADDELAGEGADGVSPRAGHAPEAVRIALQQRRLDLKAGWFDAGAFPEISFRFGVNDYEHVELEGGAVGTTIRNDAYEGRVELIHSPWGRWDGAVGLQLGRRELAATGAEAYVPPVDTASVGLFVLEQREIGAWRASLGGRLERVTHEPSGDAPRVADTAASLSAAAILDFRDDYSLALHFAAAERVPGAEELYAYGPHLASRTFETGDASLVAETSRHLDVGVRKTEGRVGWAVTVFRTGYDDFIYLADTGRLDAGSELPIFAFVQGDAELVGLEAELFGSVARLGPGEVDLRLYTDFVDAELDTGENLPRIPPRRYGVRVQYHDDRLLAGLEAVRHEEQTATAPYEDATDGFTLVSADLRWTLPQDGRAELSLFLRGSNLLDEEARRHASLVKDLAPLPGRNYAIGFRAAF